MTKDDLFDNNAIIPGDSRDELTLPSGIIRRSLDLAKRFEGNLSFQTQQKPLRFFPGIQGPCLISFSRNGEWAAIASSYWEYNPDILLWNSKNEDITTLSAKDQKIYNLGRIFSLDISPSGSYLFVGYNGGELICWDIKNCIIRVFNNFRFPILNVCALPDEQYFLQKTSEFLSLFSTTTGKYIRNVKKDLGDLGVFVLSNDGRKALFNGAPQKPMRLIDLQGDEEPIIFKDAKHGRAIAIFPDNSKVLSINFRPRLLSVWNAKNGEEISNWSYTKTEIGSREFCPKDQLKYLKTRVNAHVRDEVLLYCPNKSVAGSWDGEKILSGGNEIFMRLWTLDGQEICRFPHNTNVIKVAFLPDNQHALSGCIDGSVYLWRLP